MKIVTANQGAVCTQLEADYETHGLPELTILLVIVLVVFGAGKLPAIGAGVGKSIRNFKNAVTESDKNSEEKESQQIVR